MSTWDDILQVGKYGGVTFDFVSTRDEHSNDLDVQKFPNKPGQRIQARARNGVRIDVMAIFIEDDYPATMNKLIKQLDDGGVPKELVHPVFGTLQAACSRFTVNHDIEDAADSATVQISFEEHTDDNGLTQATDTTPARANAVRSAAADVLVALSAFSAASESLQSEITSAMSSVSAIADTLESTGESLSVLQIQASVNGVLALVESPIEQVKDYDSTEKYELAAALLVSASTLSDFANDLIQARPPLSVFAVAADTNLLALAFDLGQDPDELLALNSIPDPSLIPAGFKLSAYAA